MNTNIFNFFTFFVKIILIFGIFWNIFVVHAEPQCPFPHKIETKSDEVIKKIDACVSARASNTTATITEYNCPAWDFTLEDNAPITYEYLATHIATNILMNEVDKKMEKYMRELQKMRSKDTVAWVNEYNSCIRENANKTTLEDFYNNVCSFSFLSDFLNQNSKNNKDNKPIIASSDAYPQVMCREIAKKRIAMWGFVAENLMTSAVYKSYENDRDRFIEGVQGQYRSIIEKFHNYQKIIFRASSKITHYIRDAVK